MVSLAKYNLSSSFNLLNATLTGNGCDPHTMLGKTLQDPLIFAVNNIKQITSQRKETVFRVMFPKPASVNVITDHFIGEFRIFFDGKGKVADGTKVKALEAGTFLIAEGTVRNTDKGWLIDWPR